MVSDGHVIGGMVGDLRRSRNICSFINCRALENMYPISIPAKISDQLLALRPFFDTFGLSLAAEGCTLC